MATTESLTSLLQKSTIDDHEEVLRSCNAILKKSKTDLSTRHVKAVALLKLDRYDEALETFESGGKPLQDKALLDYSYSLYRAGKPVDASRIAAEIQDERGARHVEAQALYRQEIFSAAATIYEELSSKPSTETNDLRINRRAVEAQSIWVVGTTVEPFKPDRQDLDSFETAYNAACSSIARGQLKQAEVLLTRAKELCKYSQNLSDEEKTAELLPIQTQQLYVLESLGKSDDANKVATEIKAEQIADDATQQIARHNLFVAGSQQSNRFLMQKELNPTTKYKATDKPFGFQDHLLTHNRHVTALASLKQEGLIRSTAKVLSDHKSSQQTSRESTSAGVFNASAHLRSSLDHDLVGKPGLKVLSAQLAANPYNIGLLLTLVQLQISLKNPSSAISLLESFFSNLAASDIESNTKNSLRFNPGLTALAVSLYKIQGRKAQATRTLGLAATHWLQDPKPPVRLLQAAGISLLLDSSNPEDTETARQIFQVLYKIDYKDPINKLGHVASQSTGYAQQEVSTAETSSLRPISDLIASIDIDALEAAGIPSLPKSSTTTQTSSTKKRPSPTDHQLPKPKRIRKSRLPRDSNDPNNPPDPERWLPLRDRSGYKPKKSRGKDRGKQRGDERTQGGMGAEEIKAPVVSPGVVGATGAGGGGAKKGKKKGKR